VQAAAALAGDGVAVDAVVVFAVEGGLAVFDAEHRNLAAVGQVVALAVERHRVGFFPVNQAHLLKTGRAHGVKQRRDFPDVVEHNRTAAAAQNAVRLSRELLQINAGVVPRAEIHADGKTLYAVRPQLVKPGFAADGVRRVGQYQVDNAV